MSSTLQLVGMGVLAIIALWVLFQLVGIVFSIVSTIVSLLVSLVLLAIIAGLVYLAVTALT